MVQLLRTGTNQVINLANATMLTYRENGKIIDEANEVYTPVFTVEFVKGAPLRIEGTGAATAWCTLLEHMEDGPEANGNDDVVAELARQVEEMRTKLSSYSLAGRVLTSVMVDIITRLKSAKTPLPIPEPAAITPPYVPDGSPFDSIEEHVTASNTPPPWQDSLPRGEMASLFETGQLVLRGTGADDVLREDAATLRGQNNQSGRQSLDAAGDPGDDDDWCVAGQDQDFEDEDDDTDLEDDEIQDDDCRTLSSRFPEPALAASTNATRYPVHRPGDDDSCLTPYDGPPIDYWPPNAQPTHYRELTPAVPFASITY
jgi:hypothetical protein